MPTVTRDPLSEPGIPRPNQAEYRETPISYRGKEITRTMSNKTLLQPIRGKNHKLTYVPKVFKPTNERTCLMFMYIMEQILGQIFQIT